MPVFKVVTRYSGDHIKSHYVNKYHDKDAVDDVISYVLRTGKTSPDLVGGFCVNPYMAADQFRIIARVHNIEALTFEPWGFCCKFPMPELVKSRIVHYNQFN